MYFIKSRIGFPYHICASGSTTVVQGRLYQQRIVPKNIMSNKMTVGEIYHVEAVKCHTVYFQTLQTHKASTGVLCLWCTMGRRVLTHGDSLRRKYWALDLLNDPHSDVFISHSSFHWTTLHAGDGRFRIRPFEFEPLKHISGHKLKNQKQWYLKRPHLRNAVDSPHTILPRTCDTTHTLAPSSWMCPLRTVIVTQQVCFIAHWTRTCILGFLYFGFLYFQNNYF